MKGSKSEPISGSTEDIKMRRAVEFTLVAVAVLLLPLVAAGADESKQQKRIEKSAAVLRELTGIAEKGIPQALLDKCAAIMVFPSVYKGGLGFGGRHGKGVVCSRLPKTGSWSAPFFVKITGGSFGLQIGLQSTDFVLVVMNKRGLEGLLRNKFTLGADASIAAGPVGRRAEAATDAGLNAEIYSYSRSRGAFIGVSLEGAVISNDDQSNSRFYGRSETPATVLFEGKVSPPPAAHPLIQALNQCCPNRK
jgi:lipid-binding SYLF domain-containing protein